MTQPALNSQTLRQLFLEYFEARGHTRVASSPLVPMEEERSLLFTNSGMVPFKPVFTGKTISPHSAVVSIQRCMRAGGKHNDLENVGYTARHHTFFEMCGNFSFGSYFKREAIQYAWEFLTKILALSPDRLWVTVFNEDSETESIWLNEMKIDPTRFSQCDAEDNFWSMGESGPCGPCTEIFYDHGAQVPGGPPGSEDSEGDRYVEIWNLVFMQYDKTPNGQLIPLPKPCVDTGMGLERLAAVMQGVTNNYDTDLFQPLIHAIKQQLGQVPLSTLRVIADHLRASVFLMMEGVYPGREGRAYVLRRIIRRAARHGYQCGLHTPFLYQLVSVFIAQMGSVYPELIPAETRITQQLRKEEQQFESTLHHGMKCFEEAISQLNISILSGETVFKLYDTYGFPVDLTADLARERGLQVDYIGFESAMRTQQQKSQSSHSFTTTATPVSLNVEQTTQFTGYHALEEKNCHIVALIKAGNTVSQLHAGDTGQVILDHTPFYAESGGQVGDHGYLEAYPSNTSVVQAPVFQVTDTQKQGDHILHIGQVVTGSLSVGQMLSALVNAKRRACVALNHSATHLLHAALRHILGDEVQQKGSLVAPTHLRFDFSYSQALTAEQINQIEQFVNQCIWENLGVETQWLSREKAKQLGAIALFSEKYGEHVRVLQIGEISMELCGGTHVGNTSEIGLFKITSTSSIASGVRRIEAVTGPHAFTWLKALEQESLEVANLLKTERTQILNKLQKQLSTAQAQTNEILQLRHYLTHTLAGTLSTKAQQIKEINLIVEALPEFTLTQLREIIDQLKSGQTNCIIVLVCRVESTLHVSVGVAVDKIKANALISMLAPLISGKGGGRADFAQMKGHSTKKIESILESIRKQITEQIELFA